MGGVGDHGCHRRFHRFGGLTEVVAIGSMERFAVPICCAAGRNGESHIVQTLRERSHNVVGAVLIADDSGQRYLSIRELTEPCRRGEDNVRPQEVDMSSSYPIQLDGNEHAELSPRAPHPELRSDRPRCRGATARPGRRDAMECRGPTRLERG
jgi:hypothetical protein